MQVQVQVQVLPFAVGYLCAVERHYSITSRLLVVISHESVTLVLEVPNLERRGQVEQGQVELGWGGR